MHILEMESTYQVHANECIAIILSLRHIDEYIFPSELIQMIIRLYWNLWSAPVLMLITSKTSRLCSSLNEMWYPSIYARKGESILCKLTERYSGLRFVNQVLENPELYPLGVRSYSRWFPMIVLIPGPLWDHAMLYPELDIELIDGVRVMNGIWQGNKWGYIPNYDIQRVDEFVRWFADSLNNSDFIAAQNKLL